MKQDDNNDDDDRLLTNMKCISYRNHKTSDCVRTKVKSIVGRKESLLATINKRRRMSWFAYATQPNGLCETIIKDTVEGRRRQETAAKNWIDNVKEWTDMIIP